MERGDRRRRKFAESGEGGLQPGNTSDEAFFAVIPSPLYKIKRKCSESPRLRAEATASPLHFLVFLQPELVHAGERVGLFRLQPMPTIEIAEETITAKEIAVVLHHSRRKFEPDEHQAVLGNEGFDVRNCQSVLLHVKQKVAALAGAEEIAGPGYILEG